MPASYGIHPIIILLIWKNTNLLNLVIDLPNIVKILKHYWNMKSIKLSSSKEKGVRMVRELFNI